MTSVSALSSSTTTYSTRQNSGSSSAIRDGMKSLFEAAKSGDMDAVKSAYESLSKLASSSSSSSTTSSSDPLSTLLSNLSSAVDSGDIGQVQQAIENSRPSGQPPQGGPRGGPPPDGQGGGQPPSQESVEAMGEIGGALQSGDLDSAKTAYGSLLKSLGLDDDSSSSSSSASSSSTTSSSSTADDFSKLLSELGGALDSGSLSAAQSIFSSLTPRGSQGVDTYA